MILLFASVIQKKVCSHWRREMMPNDFDAKKLWKIQRPARRDYTRDLSFARKLKKSENSLYKSTSLVFSFHRRLGSNPQMIKISRSSDTLLLFFHYTQKLSSMTVHCWRLTADKTENPKRAPLAWIHGAPESETCRAATFSQMKSEKSTAQKST